ncbi:uncharacterized protein I303_101830 [Kwoniella dejecticola CBS 10117]|uniref:F-box domain-containing protein n=1 Tax=Kwoniella dejecticola CBS 10117 TaxID=1296121 RepID=A0A1A6ACN8_9TREE|nr:uncharacterized protein I303_02034 [Kwoniella dejecticola CBS 10117]OBR87821.1 hypothetical protein I303_02034 [Kwoniella dejecticola CBS 10117]
MPVELNDEVLLRIFAIVEQQDRHTLTAIARVSQRLNLLVVPFLHQSLTLSPSSSVSHDLKTRSFDSTKSPTSRVTTQRVRFTQCLRYIDLKSHSSQYCHSISIPNLDHLKVLRVEFGQRRPRGGDHYADPLCGDSPCSVLGSSGITPEIIVLDGVTINHQSDMNASIADTLFSNVRTIIFKIGETLNRYQPPSRHRLAYTSKDRLFSKVKKLEEMIWLFDSRVKGRPREMDENPSSILASIIMKVPDHVKVTIVNATRYESEYPSTAAWEESGFHDYQEGVLGRYAALLRANKQDEGGNWEGNVDYDQINHLL